jgi:S-adenosyl methyltransferase
MVRAHATELLKEEHSVRFVAGDFLEPEGILNDDDTRELIDFSRPVGLLIIAL